jgi:hypothetical protein
VFCFAGDIKVVVGRRVESLGPSEYKAGVLTTESLHLAYWFLNT